MPFEFDPLSPNPPDNPYPVYRRLRDEAPVYFSAERNMYCVTRFADVMTVLRDDQSFSSRAMFDVLMAGSDAQRMSWGALSFMARLVFKGRVNPLNFRKSRSIVAEDGESHSAMRAVVNRGFTPSRITAWEPRAREIVDECLAPIRGGGEFDVMRDLAVPLPVTIISEMLGVPTLELANFKHWSDAVIEMSTGSGRMSPFSARYANAFSEMARCFGQLARERRAEPRDDVVSALVAGQSGSAGLSDLEVVQFVILLMVAGNETTTNLIGNLVHTLLDHPDQVSLLLADPSKIPGAIEEGVRYDTPIQMLFRTTTRALELAGTSLPAGAVVAVILGSANRDERRFENPDRFDIQRTVQGYPGFGFGKHFCLGASLARLEASAALEALLPLWSRISRLEADVARIDSYLVRGPERLAVRVAA